MATFAEYVKGLGATQASIGYGDTWAQRNAKGMFQQVDPGGGEHGAGYSGAWTIGGNPWQRVRADYNIKRLGPIGNPRFQAPPARYSQGEQTYGGPGSQPGFVDAQGGFLGYGTDFNSLRSNSGLAAGYAEDVAVDPVREQQIIANNAERQRLFNVERQARLDALPRIGQNTGGPSQLTGLPQGFSGFGGPMQGFGAQQQQAQPGLLGGLHRGKFGGTGLLGGNNG